MCDMEKRTGKTDPHSVFSNLSFLMGELRSYAGKSFFWLPVSILIRVLMPFIGILLPNIVVKAITEGESFAHLAAVVLALGAALMAGSYGEQYIAGVMESEASQFCQGISNRLFFKRLYCDYENLEDKTVSGHFQEAERGLWYEGRYFRKAAENLALFGSGVFGFALYLSVLRDLHPALLLLMTAGTCVSFFFADMGQKERAKREHFFGDAVRRIANLHYSCSDPAAGKDIRLYGMYDWFEKRFALVHRQIREDYVRLEKKNFLSALITAGLGGLMEICAYLSLTGRVMNGRMTIAEYVLCIGAVLGFSAWVRQIADQLQKLWIMKADVDVIRRCLDMPDRSALRALPVEGEKADADVSRLLQAGQPCEIEFDHVFYRYPGSDKDTIKDLSFHIERGERIALVGMNGAGKTTCVKLLCGLLTPTAGEIRINKIPSWKFEKEEYYRLFSTVFQEINLFPATIRENITGMGKDGADESRMEKCLRLAGLWERVERMPAKADTVLVKELEEDAVNLSGGETQRLLLARALYKKAPVLVLDEPTAALDPISESNVYEKYFSLTKNCTSVFISHRLASTRFCSRIFFLEDGGIAEIGSHEELLAAGGAYARAFEVQSRYYKEHPQKAEEEVAFA